MLRLISALAIIYAHALKRLNITKISFAPYNRVMRALSAIAELLVFCFYITPSKLNDDADTQHNC